MVISNGGGLTSDLINLQLPDSRLATNETSALCGTKPLASASDSQWKSLERESMVPVNTPQSSWWGGQLMWAQRWIGAWGTAPVAVREGVRAGCRQAVGTPPNWREKIQTWNTRQRHDGTTSNKPKSLCLWNLHRGVPTEVQVWFQLKCWKVTCGPAWQTRAMPRALMHQSVWEVQKWSQSPGWVRIHHGNLLRAHLLFCWHEEKL